MNGPRMICHRHDDALSQIDSKALVRLLATYYRDVGWWVEYVGTDAADNEFHGSVDLRLRRNSEVVLVCCKHWSAKQVPHNAVDELLGAMVKEDATGAILVGSGEFTRAAIDAAKRHGRVRLIDSETLHGMLGLLPEDTSAEMLDEVHPAPSHPHRNVLFWVAALIFAIAFIIIVRSTLDRTVDSVESADGLQSSAAMSVVARPML